MEAKRDLCLGDRIKCKNWQDMKITALNLSADGYGIAVIGFSDMQDFVLTIMALPEGSEK